MESSQVVAECDIEKMIQEFDTEEKMRDEIKRSIGASFSSLHFAGCLFVKMESSGYSTDFVSQGTAKTLRALGNGTLIPEVMDGDFQGLIQIKLRSLPRKDQHELVVNQKPVPLVVLKNGSVETLLVNVRNLKDPAQIRQVFGNGYVRSESEQRPIIEANLAKSQISEKSESPEVKVVKTGKNPGIIAGGVFISKKQIIAYLMELE